ncbi:HD-GYP domain-containing protein [Candidatus Magnetominusculus xianensis]|uniref:HD-GYP domain-containing protein n=1 Tax=Candidatus Magnetominusculus xianensis TaxID=1748249 RepID=UPI001A0096B6|nr:HD-GYP domain-containing protein [Candidatus Magnetominusculus xianensis]MBF0404497.1 HD-GYP domain-containing protein [Nitrospirota bacterium]
MIKRVQVTQLELGMFICDLNCNWIEHNFLFSKFKIDNPKDIQKIQSMGIKEVSIDTSKGLDVLSAPSAAQVKKDMDAKFLKHIEELSEPLREVPLLDEIKTAKLIRAEAKETIKNVLTDVRLGNQISIESVQKIVPRMTDSIFRNKDALLGLSRIKSMDEYLFFHSVSACVLMVSLSHSLGLTRQEMDDIGMGALLHDIGKVKVPPEILNKPGKLTDDEFGKMKDHVTYGYEILRKIPNIPETAILVTHQHHERFDGTGYPNKLKGDELSIYGQMAAIVDVYDALTSDRCYHKGMQSTDALRKIFEWSQFHFNPIVVQHFIRCVGVYPIGTLVRLDDQRLAVVIGSGKRSLLHPTVRVILNIKNRAFLRPLDIDLSDTKTICKIISWESPADYDINPFEYTDLLRK